MSLTKCLKQLGISEADASILMEDTQNLTMEGWEAREAALQAIEIRLEEYQGERQSIIDQLTTQGVDISATLPNIEVEEITDNEEIQRIADKYSLLTAEQERIGATENDLRTIGGTSVAPGFISETTAKYEDGQIATVHRGTNQKLNPKHFERESLGYNSGYTPSGLGVWLTLDIEDAATWGAHTEQFYVDIRNPRKYTEEDFPQYDTIDEYYAHRESLRAEGYDGVVVDYSGVGGAYQFIAFDPNQIVQIPKKQEEYFQDAQRNSIGLYSAVEQTALDMRLPAWNPSKKNPDGRASGKDIWAKISTMPVKKEELNWLGLEQFLTGYAADHKFTREEVAEFIRNNGVTVEVIEADQEGGDSYDAYEDTMDWDNQGTYDDPDAWEHSTEEMMNDFDNGQEDSIYVNIDDWMDDWLSDNTTKAIDNYYHALPEDQQAELDSREYDSDKLDYLRDDLALDVSTDMRQEARDDFEVYADNQAQQMYYEEPYYIYYNDKTDLYIFGNDELGWSVREGSILYQSTVSRDEIYSIGEAQIQAEDYARDRGLLEDDMVQDSQRAQWEDYVTDEVEYENYRELKYTLPDIDGEFVESAHFQDENLVAWTRATDRNITFNEEAVDTAHIEEMQSDWHQQGRKFGYTQPIEEFNTKDIKDQLTEFADKNELTQEQTSALEELYGVDQVSLYALSDYYYGKKWSILNQSVPDTKDKATVQETEKVLKETETGKQIIAHVNNMIRLRKDIPDAPFKKTEVFQELAMKAFIVDAVSRGESYISWADADELIARWSERYATLYRNQYDGNMKKIAKKLLKAEPTHRYWAGGEKGQLSIDNMREDYGVKESEHGGWLYYGKDNPALMLGGKKFETKAEAEAALESHLKVDNGGYWIIPISDKVKAEIKDRGMTLFQRAPVFRHAMREHLSEKLPGKGTPQNMKQSIESFKKKGQIKAEELEWSGLMEWLDEQDGKVTKKEIIEFLEENEIEVEEVLKGAPEGQVAQQQEGLVWGTAESLNPNVRARIEGSLDEGEVVSDIEHDQRHNMTISEVSSEDSGFVHYELHRNGDFINSGSYEEMMSSANETLANLQDNAQATIDTLNARLIDRNLEPLDAEQVNVIQQGGREMVEMLDDFGARLGIQTDDILTERSEAAATVPTQYGSYTLTGEKKNYRELLLTLKRPQPKAQAAPAGEASGLNKMTWYDDITYYEQSNGMWTDTQNGQDYDQSYVSTESMVDYITQFEGITEEELQQSITPYGEAPQPTQQGTVVEKTIESSSQLTYDELRAMFQWNDQNGEYIDVSDAEMTQIIENQAEDTGWDEATAVNMWNENHQEIVEQHNSRNLMEFEDDGGSTYYEQPDGRWILIHPGAAGTVAYANMQEMLDFNGIESIGTETGGQLSFNPREQQPGVSPWLEVDQETMDGANDFWGDNIRQVWEWPDANLFMAESEDLLYSVANDMDVIEEGFETRADAEAYVREIVGAAQPELLNQTVTPDVKSTPTQQKFYGGHFTGDADILSWLRFNDRTDADGKKVMFIEEIQSDWHQKGRSQGYGENTPDAPFKQSWPMLAMKRAIRYASENGYDSIAWTTGSQQNARYNLSSHVERIDWKKVGDNYTILAYKKGNTSNSPDIRRNNLALKDMQELIGIEMSSYIEGQATELSGNKPTHKDVQELMFQSNSGNWYLEIPATNDIVPLHTDDQNVATNKAISVVEERGQGITAVETAYGVVDGEQLELGGEGMRGFYDTMLPRMTNKYVKKWGGKVGKTKVSTGKESGWIVNTKGGVTVSKAFNTFEEAVAEKESIIKETGNEFGDYSIETGGQVDSQEVVHSLDITEKMTDAAMAGQSLFQGAKRGSIQFGDKETIINLFKAKNLSTLLHETGHLFLGFMQDISSRPDAAQSLKDEWANIEKALGLKPGQALNVEHHETWAKQFEAYLRAGKAPSIELRGPFRAFRSWLITVYDNIKKLLGKEKINEDLTKIFDRMLATDAEIEAAAADNYNAIFDNAADFGGTDEQFAEYNKVAQEVLDKAREEMDSEVIREVAREKKAAYKKQRERVRTDVELEVNQDKDIRAKHFLTSGKFLVGDPLEEVIDGAIKLDSKILKEMYADTKDAHLVRKLPPGMKRIEGAVHPDVAAEMLGYKSGDELVRAMAETGNRKNIIEEETDARMDAEHGNLALDVVRATDAALDALHSDKTAHFLMMELRALNKKTGAGQTQSRVLKEIANGMVETSLVPEAARSARFLTEERKAGATAQKAAAEKNFEAAREAKRHQILSHYMYMASRDAKADQDKFSRYFKKFDKKGTRKALKGEYLDQIDGILEGYDFRTIPLRDVEKLQPLREWVDEQRNKDIDPNVSAEVMDNIRRVNYRELTMEQYRGLYDAVKSIEKIARNENEFKAGQEKLKYEDVVRDLVDTAYAENVVRNKAPIDPNVKGLGSLTKDFFRGIDATLLKVEQMIAWLDGDKPDGPWHNYVFKRVADAEHHRNDLDKKYTTKLIEAFEDIPEYHRRKIGEKLYVEELSTDITRGGLIAIALNLGTKSNLFKLIEGSKQLPTGAWTEEGVRAALNRTMKEEDWKLVDKILRILNHRGEDSLFDMLNEVDKEQTGTPLKKVEALAIPTPFGILEGGYYPIAYDKRFSTAGTPVSAEFNVPGGRPSTRAGSVHERIETYSAPISLDLRTIPKHISEVIQDVTHRTAVQDLYKLFTDQRVRKVLQETLGEKYEPHFRHWLSHVANDKMQDQTGVDGWMQVLRRVRLNTSIVAMNFKATTVIQQPLGMTQSIDLMRGMKGSSMHLTKAIADFSTGPLEMRDFVFEKSGEMRHRMNNLDRDLRENLRKRIGKKSYHAEMVRIGFMGIGIADMAVSLPTWMASYKWALDNNYTEQQAVEWADSRVRLSQGSGSAKDLSAVQRGHEAMKLLTVFYSYFNAYYNRIHDSVRQARGKGVKGGGEFMLRHFWITMIPAIFSEILTGRGPEEDEDPADWATRKIIAYPFMTVPLVRDVANAVESGYGYDWTPAGGIGEHSSRLILKADDWLMDEADASDVVKQAVKTSGYFLGLPTGQASITFGHIADSIEGDTDFNPWYLLFREPDE